jgi:hypothetical protein
MTIPLKQIIQLILQIFFTPKGFLKLIYNIQGRWDGDLGRISSDKQPKPRRNN